MSFSTDLDAVRKRAGLPVIYRLECRRHAKHEHIITIDAERAKRFIGQHAIKTHGQDVHVTYLEGPGRFRIKRTTRSVHDPFGTPWPWLVSDAERPGVFGRARTHAAAIKLVDLMRAHPGEHAQVLDDDDDEVLAYITGTPRPEGGVATARTTGACTCMRLIPDESAPWGYRHERGCPRA